MTVYVFQPDQPMKEFKDWFAFIGEENVLPGTWAIDLEDTDDKHQWVQLISDSWAYTPSKQVPKEHRMMLLILI